MDIGDSILFYHAQNKSKIKGFIINKIYNHSLSIDNHSISIQMPDILQSDIDLGFNQTLKGFYVFTNEEDIVYASNEDYPVCKVLLLEKINKFWNFSI